MKTPDSAKKIGGTAKSKLEDSPVYKFLNNLSPIDAVKSIGSLRTVQTLQFGNFAHSSAFSTPHADRQGESGQPIRNPFDEPSKREISLGGFDGSNRCTGSSSETPLSSCTASAQEPRSIACSLNDATIEPPSGSSSLSRNLPPLMQYDAFSPDYNKELCYGVTTDVSADMGPKTVEEVKVVPNCLDNGNIVFGTEKELWEKQIPHQNRDETVASEWGKYVASNAGDLSICDSLTEAEAHLLGQKLADNNHYYYSHKTQAGMSSGYYVQNVTLDPQANIVEMVKKEDRKDHRPQMLSGTNEQIQGRIDKPIDCNTLGCKVGSQQQRGMCRRCLFSGVSGISEKNGDSDSNVEPSISKTFTGKMASAGNNLKPGTNTPPFVLPNMRFHLHTFATTSKDRIVSQHALASGQQLISIPSAIEPFHAPAGDQKSGIESLGVRKELLLSGSGVQELQELQGRYDDHSLAIVPANAEKLSQGSPQKKKGKSESCGRANARKRCSCKKSKCLKLYCECFVAGIYCSEPCACQGCLNRPIHEEIVLSTRKQIEARNPLAFAPKIIQTSGDGQEIGENSNKTPASARHKRGCNCKKSNCQKKYCECYQASVGCSINCRCEGCRNAFGTKNGIVPIVIEEIKHGKQEKDAWEKEMEELQCYELNVENEEHQSFENLPMIPFEARRPLAELPNFINAKPLQSSANNAEYTLQHKFYSHPNPVLYDGASDAARGKENEPLSYGVKILSPNRKRLSPARDRSGLGHLR
ncbi:CRC domain-containing protein TSO1 [Ananas comosus]|uniref:CRC domain-containing protein TSO1 n=1 Tax=Ananas comosus TaxID=4615 RepID=A0A199VQZ8_ANACO|nr:CRC domain-containing protein TSO1 [Ananas comosus]